MLLPYKLKITTDNDKLLPYGLREEFWNPISTNYFGKKRDLIRVG
jgi:hypothetical protein